MSLSKPIRIGFEVLWARMMPGIASGDAAMLPSSKRREKFVIEYVSHWTAPVVAVWRSASLPAPGAAGKHWNAWLWRLNAWLRRGRGAMKRAGKTEARVA